MRAAADALEIELPLRTPGERADWKARMLSLRTNAVAATEERILAPVRAQYGDEIVDAMLSEESELQRLQEVHGAKDRAPALWEQVSPEDGRSNKEGVTTARQAM